MIDPWDSLLEDAEASRLDNRAKCKTCLLLEELTDRAREEITKALGRAELPATAIAVAIEKRVCRKVSAESLRRHRRGDCRRNEG
jgi:hypothetical protein